MSSATEATTLSIRYVAADDAMLVVSLSDGRKLSMPLEWYPRLAHGSPTERNHWRLIGRGEGVHWPDLDEDLSLESFLAGRRSQESRQSLKKWRDARKGRQSA